MHFLQLENILLDDNFNAKLSDFGFASYIDTDNQLTGIYCCTVNNCDKYMSQITSLVVTPSVTRGRAKMLKTVTLRLTRSTDSETDGHGGVITVTLRFGESVVN